MKQLTEQAAQGKPTGADYLRWDLGANPPVLSEITPMSLPSGAWAASVFVRASPTGRLVFFRQDYKQTNPVSQREERQKLYALYDPETSHLLPLRLPTGFGSYGHWVDDNHLLICGDTSRVSESLDVATHAVIPYAATPKAKRPREFTHSRWTPRRAPWTTRRPPAPRPPRTSSGCAAPLPAKTRWARRRRR